MNMTGGHVTYPLLISLANIKMQHCNKASNHVFLLITLLPVAQFVYSDSGICTVLST